MHESGNGILPGRRGGKQAAVGDMNRDDRLFDAPPVRPAAAEVPPAGRRRLGVAVDARSESIP